MLEPCSQVMQDLEDALLELFAADAAEADGAHVAVQIAGDLVCQPVRVDLDELDDAGCDHGRLLGERTSSHAMIRRSAMAWMNVGRTSSSTLTRAACGQALLS